MVTVKWVMGALVALAVFSSGGATAADIQNDSKCDVCEGAIHFSPAESREILGKKIQEKVAGSDWQGQKSVWVDLDGVMANATAPADTGQYELNVYGTRDMVFIKSLVDGSMIEVRFPSVTAGEEGASEGWAPEIYLYGAESESISLKDSLEKAWRKMGKAHVYQWAGQGKDVTPPPAALRQKIMEAMRWLSL